MGGSTYRDEDLTARKQAIKSSGKDTFAYTADMRKATKTSDIKCHPNLAIDKKKIRESRDSATHPQSNALAVIFDVTGSMGTVPVELEVRLKDLMGYFLKKDYLPNVHILFGAVGDSKCDKVPLQIGEFEPGAEELMDFFQRVYLEGLGGGNGGESYPNAIYFMARHTSIDTFEKRGKKGYLFLIGDELPHEPVSVDEIAALMGKAPFETDIPVEQIVKEAQEKYQVFYIIPRLTDNARDPRVWKRWRELLGNEFVVGMDKTEQVCELIGTLVGVCEGKIDAEKATENLRGKDFEAEYLGIAKAAFRKLAGINATKVSAKDTPTSKSKKGNPKTSLKI
ncbi:MAG: hypothetical protein UW46_C0004G0017 [Candidatus Yanofskybacteria bacterium GW2011_GWF1_44_227]|uniref:VWFA domain-containing protein n=1 Tax=Candidatus Yanofskybacteria bacterium GW2011_GWE2_40_11 TaxID=1619033 RepID=A0A0G0TQ17_9BACT|nr:MAG: hypothetical protein UT75_C0012G0006 [Candidatus Yanofskybacteria bacterium GW2011_GWE2_40_11]KKT15228.1 MAG: hypothetical protein UV97_C0010G0011 [Candidatus Yanofskybacteria bacterium GW2011_GWF2_43_596]KKT53290.1 MAG: hypothetical protein UW46_C0004G0017 [Candidatus Yanofskybacteria bacterium GW2011_GWF1_44_227]OGN37473.1 MAG: hypothetical protein A2302_03210 [Candidatus Yanofskybacteria bacterium RIFOXYB2_FULL_44_18]OGN39479.1 MAG: hypothetical protein A2457_02525 [Candidatus Yanofs